LLNNRDNLVCSCHNPPSYYYSFQDDNYPANREVRHYPHNSPKIKIRSMLRQDFTHLAIFEGLSTAQLAQLEPVLERCKFRTGHVVFDQGSNANYLYILLTGKVEVVYKPYDGPPLTVARINSGGVFGWSAALGREAYTSAAIVTEAGEAIRLSGANLHHLCEQSPQVGTIFLDRLAGVIAERIQNTHDQVLAILSQGLEASEDCNKEG